MTKILIDEAVVRQALEDFVAIKYGLEKSRIWGGMDWTYNSMHPVHYLPLRDKAEAQMESINQALANEALDKMAENARELGLTYEQPAQQEPVAWGIIASNTGRICQVELDADEVEGHNPKHIVPLYTTPPAPAQEPDPDELTIAYMSGLYDGKKRKPWVGLTDEQYFEIGQRYWLSSDEVKQIHKELFEAAHGITKGKP